MGQKMRGAYREKRNQPELEDENREDAKKDKNRKEGAQKTDQLSRKVNQLKIKKKIP